MKSKTRHSNVRGASSCFAARPFRVIRWLIRGVSPAAASCARRFVFASTMSLVLLWPSIVLAGVHALFSLETPTGSPFPSDQFTVADPSHNTGRRVNLPISDCAVRRSDCEDLAVINTLDGFNAGPRLSIPFDGPIDVTTVISKTVFLVDLGSAVRHCDAGPMRDCDEDQREDRSWNDHSRDDGRRVIGINQVVWDASTNTVHVESNELLDQHTHYAFIVTNGVHAEDGSSVQASEAFRRFRHTVRGEYKQALLDAIQAAHRVGVHERDIVTASVFTTQSVTSVLEKIRDQIKAATPQPADFRLGPAETRTVFPLQTVVGITWEQQTGNDPPTFMRVTVNSSLLQLIPGAVGTIAFGKYNSPDYEVHPGEFIPLIGTLTGTPAVQGTNEIYFNLFLPSGPKPALGWPVAIFGHGNGQDKSLSFNVAATMAAHGIATIAINAVGAGFGPLGTLTVNRTAGEPRTFSAGGRSIDQNGDHVIEAGEGFNTAPPRTILFFTDGIRQTVTDLMQIVRVIEVGMDVDGDGFPDLDPSRIYYFGHSLGSNYGTVFVGIDPSVKVATLTSPGGPVIENRRLAPSAGRSVLGQALASRIPPLINAPGITSLDGVAVGPPQFNENFPLREGIPLRVHLADGTSYDIESPVINSVAGAMAIQEVVENTKWVGRPGDPVAYAPYLRKTPLAGVPAKSVIYQFAKGDQQAPNPNATAIVRAGKLADRVTFYRHDLAVLENSALPKNPHGFMVRPDIASFRPISLQAQEQIGKFFDTEGAVIIQPTPARFFEVPIILPLPEDLNFIP